MDRTSKYRRIVIKAGSNVLTRDDGRPDTTRISSLVDQIARLHRAGIEVILVSSGAVASGRSVLEQRTGRIDTVSARQLFSAVGQVKLLNRYYDLFNEYGIVCGQVLTTKESLSTRRQYLNQRNCMEVMLANGVIPIVNENDTVAIDELELEIGENDSLSATVAAAVGADLLIILSDINGLYSADPRTDANAQVIREVRKIDARIEQMAGGAGSALGSGGMATKINAAKIATEAGVDMVIMNGRDPEQLYALFDGEPIGTHFLAE